MFPKDGSAYEDPKALFEEDADEGSCTFYY